MNQQTMQNMELKSQTETSYYFGNNWGLFIDIDTNSTVVEMREIIIHYNVEEEEQNKQEEIVVIQQKHKTHKYLIVTIKIILAISIISLFSYIVFCVN
jgi:uncharacterized membrane protein YukC